MPIWRARCCTGRLTPRRRHSDMNDSNDQITADDLQALWAVNPLAAEQLRRIIAERRLAALESSIAENGAVPQPVAQEG